MSDAPSGWPFATAGRFGADLQVVLPLLAATGGVVLPLSCRARYSSSAPTRAALTEMPAALACSSYHARRPPGMRTAFGSFLWRSVTTGARVGVKSAAVLRVPWCGFRGRYGLAPTAGRDRLPVAS